MRILQINNCHYRRGGADVVYLNTGELFERKGHEVFYFSQESPYNVVCKTHDYFVRSIDYFSNSAIKKVLSIPRFFYSKEAKTNLDNLINDLNPEIAHIHTYKGTLTPSILSVLKRHSIPIVITLHDYGFICPHNSFLDGKRRICKVCYNTGNTINCIINKCNRDSYSLSIVTFLEYNFQRFFFPFENNFDQIITVCKFSYNLHNSIPEYKDKINYLYNFSPLLKTEKPLHCKGKYFLYFGRLSHEKGIMTLLKAWAEIDDSIYLKIIGNGPEENKILSFIKGNHLTNIEFLGFKQNSELWNIISNASFVITPSEVYENNPMTIIEAYTLGKPVIASNIGGIPEIVIDEYNGFLFQMGNYLQLRKIVNMTASIEENEYLKLSLNARLYAERNFSEEKYYESLLRIFEKCTNSKEL